MITGQIRNREAVIELDVSGSDHLPPQHIEAVLDTGYNGHLTLGKHLVAALQLRFAGHRRGTLADGSVTVLEMYLAMVVWHEQQREVLVAQAAGSPLVGMSLLEGSRLTMDVSEGGEVKIETSSPRP